MYAKMAEVIEMPYGRLTHVGPRNHFVRWRSRSDESIYCR